MKYDDGEIETNMKPEFVRTPQNTAYFPCMSSEEASPSPQREEDMPEDMPEEDMPAVEPDMPPPEQPEAVIQKQRAAQQAILEHSDLCTYARALAAATEHRLYALLPSTSLPYCPCEPCVVLKYCA